MMLILGLLGMYFDAVVVEVKTFLLLFRFALAILCMGLPKSNSKKDLWRFCHLFTLHKSKK